MTSKMQGACEVGTPCTPGKEPILAPGVRGFLFDRPDAIYIPVIYAEKEKAGNVSKYLDSLPKDRNVVFCTVVSSDLREMLTRRGYTKAFLWEPEIRETVEIMIRRAA